MPKKTYTLEQISEHNSKESCWMALFDKVYDVTSYLDDHPGGDLFIMQGCGKDATELFEMKSGMGKHTEAAFQMMEKLYIGDLEGR